MTKITISGLSLSLKPLQPARERETGQVISQPLEKFSRCGVLITMNMRTVCLLQSTKNDKKPVHT